MFLEVSLWCFLKIFERTYNSFFSAILGWVLEVEENLICFASEFLIRMCFSVVLHCCLGLPVLGGIESCNVFCVVMIFVVYVLCDVCDELNIKLIFVCQLCKIVLHLRRCLWSRVANDGKFNYYCGETLFTRNCKECKHSNSLWKNSSWNHSKNS